MDRCTQCCYYAVASRTDSDRPRLRCTWNKGKDLETADQPRCRHFKDIAEVPGHLRDKIAIGKRNTVG